MQPHPSNELWRPIDRSVDGLRALGVVLLVLALPLGVGIAGVNAPFWRLALSLALAAAPGAAVCKLAGQVRRRRTWAAVTAACIVGVICLLLCLPWVRGFARSLEFSDVLLPMVLTASIAAPLVYLVYQLVQAMRSMRQLGPQERGFEPIINVPPAAPPDVALHDSERRDARD